jgi:hypothetical protein
MKLSEAIKGDSKENFLKEFQALLNNGTYSKSVGLIVQGDFLYRNTKTLVDIKKVAHKKMRPPKHTPDDVDEFIDEFREKYYPHIPSRRKATFAYSNVLKKGKFYPLAHVASIYGPNLYFVFVRNDAKIFQSEIEHDMYAADFVDEIADYLWNAERFDKETVIEKALEEFEYDFDLDDDFDGNVDDYEAEKEAYIDSYLDRNLLTIKEVEDNLHRYFKKGNDSLEKVSYGDWSKGGEVVIESKDYYIVNVDVLKKYAEEDGFNDHLLYIKSLKKNRKR